MCASAIVSDETEYYAVQFRPGKLDLLFLISHFRDLGAGADEKESTLPGLTGSSREYIDMQRGALCLFKRVGTVYMTI